MGATGGLCRTCRSGRTTRGCQGIVASGRSSEEGNGGAEEAPNKAIFWDRSAHDSVRKYAYIVSVTGLSAKLPRNLISSYFASSSKSRSMISWNSSNWASRGCFDMLDATSPIWILGGNVIASFG